MNTIVSTPFSLTDLTVVLPVSKLLDPKRSFVEREVVTRLVAFVATSFFQALDLVLNFVMAMGKIILASLKESPYLKERLHLDYDDISFDAVAQHLKKVCRCFAGVVSGSIGGLVSPKFLYSLCPLAQEVEWKWETQPTQLRTLFDRGYYLNLTRRADRRGLLEEHLGALGIGDQMHRFNAVDGKNSKIVVTKLAELGVIELPKEETIDYQKIHDDFIKKVEGGDNRKGRLACYLGHLLMYIQLLDDASESGHVPTGLILEDDCRMKKGASEESKIENIKKNLPGDWDILFLGGRHDRASESLESNAHVEKVTQSVLLHAYIVNGKDNGKVYQYLVEYLIQGLKNATEENKLQPIDDLLSYIHHKDNKRSGLFTMPEWVKEWKQSHGTLNCYSPRKGWIAGQRPDFSDIEGFNKVVVCDGKNGAFGLGALA